MWKSGWLRKLGPLLPPYEFLCVTEVSNTVIRLGDVSCLYLLNYLVSLLDFNSINNINLEKSTSHRVFRMLAVQRVETLPWAHWNCLVKLLFLCRVICLTEPDSGNTEPRRVGHARKTVPYRSWNQNVGHSLFCHTEAVQRGNPEVSCYLGLVWGPLCFEFFLNVIFIFGGTGEGGEPRALYIQRAERRRGGEEWTQSLVNPMGCMGWGRVSPEPCLSNGLYWGRGVNTEPCISNGL